MGRRKEKKLEKQQAKLDKMQRKLDRKSGKTRGKGKKNQTQTQASVSSKKIDIRSNPLYPDRIESNLVGSLIAIGSMVVAVLLLAFIVTHFSYAVTGGSYVAKSTPDVDDIVENDVGEEDDVDVEDTQETDIQDTDETDGSDIGETEEEEAVSEVGIHSYELIVSDVTWQEAFDDCIARGGYLVRINSQEEWDYLITILNAQKGDACYFYIAGSRADGDSTYYWQNEEGERFGDALNDSSFWGNDLWLEGEPSFADGDTTETNLAILYQKSADRYVLNDVAGSVLKTESYLMGKLAYICEYDTSDTADGSSGASGGDAAIASVSMSDVNAWECSSALSEKGMTHSADRLMDGSLSNAWVEGADGQGIGESVTFLLRETRIVSGVRVWNGYQKSEDLFYKNSRVYELLVRFSDGTEEVLELQDTMGEQSFTFSTPKQTDSLEIEIQSVYAGNKYEDTVLSEVEFY